MWISALALTLMVTVTPSMAITPTVGVIADDLADYSQWISAHKDLWTGSQVVQILNAHGVQARLMHKDELTPEGLSRFEAVLVATDHTYPERGPWGGPVAKALVEYVRRGGVYAMPIGIPHWSSKDLDTGKLYTGHFEDIFGFKGATASPGRGPLMLTRQGSELGLSDPGPLNARPVRTMDYPERAVLVWSADYVPCLSAVPYGRGWLIHWGAGPEGGMDRSVRDYLLQAEALVIRAAREGRLKAADRQTLLKEEGLLGKSMDDIDRQIFAPGPDPFDSEARTVELTPDTQPTQTLYRSRTGSSLDGNWEMLGLPAGAGDARALLTGQGWEAAIPADIPCSVQTALFAAGKIPDPTVAFNDQIARREVAQKEWWFRKTFTWSQMGTTRLIFEGVDYSATFYLNGVRLGDHEGPFGGPNYEVTSLLRNQNTLIVRLDPLPPDWKQVFKTNCVYGWHYVNCPPIGIWRSVRLEVIPPIWLADYMVATTDAKAGVVDLSVELRGPVSGFSSRLAGRIRPANFIGPAYRFQIPIQSREERTIHHLRFTVPEPHLWWPVDLGSPDLYHIELAVKAGDRVIDAQTCRFGIRTITMAPLPDGPSPDRYNWTFVINGRPTFLKGCNWCTTDAFLRLTEYRYRRFLTMAKDEHIQIMRSWGGGLLETDLFYDICDELGIMVWQEFPLTWQEFDNIRMAVADEIAHLNITRLRNHPSLALWCGGNEHHGQGRLVELLGRRCLELDGTRPYHRTDPFGGSIHDYSVYWGKGPFEQNIKLVPFQGGPAVIGETGLASPCAVESTLKFLPKEEQDLWPPPDSGSFIHHTPTFTPSNMDHLNLHARELDPCSDLVGFTRGAQLAQALGLRIVLERMRCNWPRATAMLFYKLTDVYPGCSWSTVDYYGVPKIAHDFVRNAFSPLHVCALYEDLDMEPGKEMRTRILLLDDLEQLADAEVSVRLFDARLRQVASHQLKRSGPAQRVQDLGEVDLPVPVSDASPLLLVLDLRTADKLLDRAFYWFNFRARPGCLFNLPAASLSVSSWSDGLTVANHGDVPAVGVSVVAPEISDSLRTGDGHFWLDPGESRQILIELMPNVENKTSKRGLLAVAAWNAPISRE